MALNMYHLSTIIIILTTHLISNPVVPLPMKSSRANLRQFEQSGRQADFPSTDLLLNRLARQLSKKPVERSQGASAAFHQAMQMASRWRIKGVQMASLVKKLQKQQRNRRQKRNLLTDLIDPHMNL